MRKVIIETRTVGQAFGCCAVIRDTRTRRKIAETETVRPYNFRAAAFGDGEVLAEKNGWQVVSGEED